MNNSRLKLGRIQNLVCVWSLKLNVMGWGVESTLLTPKRESSRGGVPGHDPAALANHNLLIRRFWPQLVDQSARPADDD